MVGLSPPPDPPGSSAWVLGRGSGRLELPKSSRGLGKGSARCHGRSLERERRQNTKELCFSCSRASHKYKGRPRSEGGP